MYGRSVFRLWRFPLLVVHRSHRRAQTRFAVRCICSVLRFGVRFLSSLSLFANWCTATSLPSSFIPSRAQVAPLPFPSAIRTNFPHCLEVAMQTLRNVCSCLNHCDVAFSSLQAGLHLQSTFTSLGYVSEAGVHRFIYDCVPLSCLARKPLCCRKKQLKSFVIFATRNCGAKSKMRNLHSLNFQDFRLFSWLPGCRIRSRNVVLPGFFELLGDFYNGTLCCSPRVLIHTVTWPFCDIFCGINSDCAEVMRVTTRHAASAVDPCQGWAKSRVLLLKM